MANDLSPMPVRFSASSGTNCVTRGSPADTAPGQDSRSHPPANAQSGLHDMKNFVFTRYAKSNHSAFTDLPRSILKADEFLVEVEATGLNPINTMIPKRTLKQFL